MAKILCKALMAVVVTQLKWFSQFTKVMSLRPL